MFIQSLLRPNADVLVIYEYPSVADSKGTIDDSNMKRYMMDNLRKMGIPCNAVAHHCMIDYPMGWNSVDEFYLTKKADKTNDKLILNGHYFHPNHSRMFNLLSDAIEFCNPKVIICTSQLALSYFSTGKSIFAFRGSMLEPNVVVTYGPMDLYKKTENHIQFKRDLLRVRDVLEGKQSCTLPDFKIAYDSDFDKVTTALRLLLGRLDKSTTALALDIETRLGGITFFGIAWSKRDALVIPFITWDDDSYWTAEQEFAIVSLLRKLLVHPNLRSIGQNFQYDLQYIVKLWGVRPYIHLDTMVEAHLNWTKGQRLSLDFLSSMYCEWYRYWKEDGKDFHKSFKQEADHTQYALYNGYDCCYTYEVGMALAKVSARNPYPDTVTMQRSMQNIVVTPVLRGIPFDSAKQRQWRGEYAHLLKQYQNWFRYLVDKKDIHTNGEADWFDSPTQLSFFFYKQLGVDKILDKKTKRPTTNDAALAAIGKSEPILRPLTDMLQSYRSLSKFYDSYLAAKTSPEDGRMRTQYMLAGTDTFRLASKGDAFGYGLNLQNITKG